MLKVAVIGSVTQDVIHLPNRTKTKSFGGIFYNLLSLSYLNLKDVRIYPVCNLGEDICKEAISILRKRKNIVVRGVRKTRGKNNQVTLFCEKSGKRKEFLLGLVPPLNFNRIRPYLSSDIILVNFISGLDLSLKTLERLRQSTKKPIFIDIHSLTLGMRKDGGRFPRKPKSWKRYVRCADILQMNWEEFLVLSDRKVRSIQQARKWGERILKLGPKALIVTLGKRGALVIYQEDEKIKYYYSVSKSKRIVDTVGCGDVFASAFISAYLRRKSLKFCLDFSNRVAGVKSNFSGIGKIKELSRFALG